MQATQQIHSNEQVAETHTRHVLQRLKLKKRCDRKVAGNAKNKTTELRGRESVENKKNQKKKKTNRSDKKQERRKPKSRRKHSKTEESNCASAPDRKMDMDLRAPEHEIVFEFDYEGDRDDDFYLLNLDLLYELGTEEGPSEDSSAAGSDGEEVDAKEGQHYNSSLNQNGKESFRTAATDKLSDTDSSTFDELEELVNDLSCVLADAKPKKSARFADEDGQSIAVVHITPARVYKSAIVLIFCPVKRSFEFIHIEHDRDDPLVKVSDLVEQLPRLAVNPRLTRNLFVGLCRVGKEGEEMFNFLPLCSYELEKNELLLAIPAGYTCKDAIDMALPIIADPSVTKSIRKRIRSGRSSKKLIESKESRQLKLDEARSPEFSQDQTPSSLVRPKRTQGSILKSKQKQQPPESQNPAEVSDDSTDIDSTEIVQVIRAETKRAGLADKDKQTSMEKICRQASGRLSKVKTLVKSPLGPLLELELKLQASLSMLHVFPFPVARPLTVGPRTA